MRHARFSVVRLLQPGLGLGLAAWICVFHAWLSNAALAQVGEAEWIWTTEGESVPAGTAFFRKTFTLNDPDAGRLEITADDGYEAWVNGRRIGVGRKWQVLDSYDISPMLISGTNAVAIRVDNRSAGSAGLAVRLEVKDKGHTTISYASDTSWKTSTQPIRNWQHPRLNDTTWAEAVSLGALGTASPWKDQVRLADGSHPARFRLPPGFRVDRVVPHRLVGSILAMTFNERGEVIVATEQDGLSIIRDKNRDGVVETVTPYSDKIKSCQGLMALNGSIFATGFGDDGLGLYRLSDANRDGKLETSKKLVPLEGKIMEHGPHAVVLGPDGLIYVALGNFTRCTAELGAASPYQHVYEGDLVQPRYDDSNGEAAGAKAPGGVILRTDTEGTVVEYFAGGLRNTYDMAFSTTGELITYDSDTEWDEGTPWYQENRLCHLVPGSDFGWRSGWAKWPDYFVDAWPSLVTMGRGSPTGMQFYDHDRFPPEYRGVLFAGDWSLGRIVAIWLEPDGATLSGKSEVFVQGRPLNVTDLEIGPDGALYFCTGGRGTEGGLYRVVCTEETPRNPTGQGILAAIRQPMPHSAWGRNRIAALKDSLGKRWTTELMAVTKDRTVAAGDRLRALDIMQLFGPFPKAPELLACADDDDPQLRAKAATLMGLHANQTTVKYLQEMLDDTHAVVRRAACDALRNAQQPAPAELVLPLLQDEDRFVRAAARRLLESQPKNEWHDLVLDSDEANVFIQGATALMLAKEPDADTVSRVLSRAETLLDSYLSDEEFVDLLRVVQLALITGQVDKPLVEPLRERLAEEFPASDARMNQLLVQILVHLPSPEILDRLLEALESDMDPVEKLHLALYARFLETGWTFEQRIAWLQFAETARTRKGGYNLAQFVDNVTADFLKQLDQDELVQVLEKGADFPNAALQIVMQLPEKLTEDQLSRLENLDRELEGQQSETIDRLKLGIVAILGRSGEEVAIQHLRQAYDSQPNRRAEIAMGLAQHADENWEYLLKSLPLLEGIAAQEVLTQLAAADRKPEEDNAEAYRQTILAGLRLGDEGGPLAAKLLNYWQPGQVAEGTAWKDALPAWQSWYAERFPAGQPAELPVEPEGSRFTLAQIMDHLNSSDASPGDARNGAAVFVKGQCAKCHRFGSEGQSGGPDLTTVGQRFQVKEMIEAVLFPSHVVSDQYRSEIIETASGAIVNGLVTRSTGGMISVLQSNGARVVLSEEDVIEASPSQISSMPEGLFNNLTLEEIADLIAYLQSGPNDLVRKAR